MAAPDSVAKFIVENNDAIKKITAELDKATNQVLPANDRAVALSTAAHLACRRLGDLQSADRELWEPLIHLTDSERYDAPRAPVPAELFELFHHPHPKQAADLINRTDWQLEQALQESCGERGSAVAQAKHLVDQLRIATCSLQDGKAPPEQGIVTVRKTTEVIAMSSISAVVGQLIDRAGDAAPGLLHQAGELLRYAGWLDSVTLLGLAAATAIAVQAADAIRSIPGPGETGLAPAADLSVAGTPDDPAQQPRAEGKPTTQQTDDVDAVGDAPHGEGRFARAARRAFAPMLNPEEQRVDGPAGPAPPASPTQL